MILTMSTRCLRKSTAHAPLSHATPRLHAAQVGECPEGYCVDGLCAFEGHTGVLCAECETENNYYMWGGRCTLCETTTAWPILILCFMSLCLAAYFVFWQRASTGSSKIIIFFGQTMALLLNDMRRLPQANVSQVRSWGAVLRGG